MPKTVKGVRLFESDGYTYKYRLDIDDAEAMFSRGEIEVAHHPTTGDPIGYKLRGFQKATNREDPTSISLSEMKVNAGEPPKPLVYTLDKNHVKSVRAKVHAWDSVWDRNAAPPKLCIWPREATF